MKNANPGSAGHQQDGQVVPQHPALGEEAFHQGEAAVVSKTGLQVIQKEQRGCQQHDGRQPETPQSPVSVSWCHGLLTQQGVIEHQ